MSTINTPNCQIYINIPTGDSVFLLISYLDLIFEVITKTDKSRYGNGKDFRLVNVEAFVLFISFKLTTSSGKHLEDIGHDHIVFLKNKLRTSAKDTDVLSIVFDRDCGRRRDELTNNKQQKM